MDLKIEDSTLKNYTGHGINSLTIPDTVKAEAGHWIIIQNYIILFFPKLCRKSAIIRFMKIQI